MTVMSANIGMDRAQTGAAPENAFAHRIVELLRTARLPVNTEDDLQAAVSMLLADHGITHKREVKVTGGRIDIMAGATTGKAGVHLPCVGIEIKIKGGKRAIHRQCAAYCNDQRIGHLIVLTGTALALPPVMSGKVVTIVAIGRAWL